MSRVGKMPVVIPDKVNVQVDKLSVTVVGPKGTLKTHICDKIKVAIKDGKIEFSPLDSSKAALAMWGTTRALINNMVQGVYHGFTKELEFNGVGYKMVVKGNSITMNLGHSHPIDYALPAGVAAKVNGNKLELSGCSKELVGFVAAKIRSFRKPEPYKGKGVKYVTETIIRKAGKSGGKK